jgi:GntR family transcriptional regulator
MRIGVADIEAAKLLSIPLGTPVGCLRRVLTDDKGIVVLVANIIYPGDLVRLEVTS